MRTYLVERYWPGVTRERLQQALARGRSVIKQLNEQGTSVQSLGSTLIRHEDLVFSLYQAASEAAVRLVNERAAIPFNRIIEAEEVLEHTRSDV